MYDKQYSRMYDTAVFMAGRTANPAPVVVLLLYSGTTVCTWGRNTFHGVAVWISKVCVQSFRVQQQYDAIFFHPIIWYDIFLIFISFNTKERCVFYLSMVRYFSDFWFFDFSQTPRKYPTTSLPLLYSSGTSMTASPILGSDPSRNNTMYFLLEKTGTE